jgi:hypothetical protein
MSRVKGCTNENCIAKKKKITYKESDDFCSKCGGKLSYVCPKCYTKLPEGISDKLCARHLAEKEDKRDERKKRNAKIAAAIIVPIGTVAVANGKKIAEAGKKAIGVIAKLK